MTHYTIEVSNHPRAGERPVSEEAGKSWERKYDGPIATAKEAKQTVDELAHFYRHVRAFRARSSRSTLGKVFYEVGR